MIQHDNGRALGEELLVGRQPTPLDVQLLAFRGVRAILSLNRDDEDEDVMTDAAEASWAVVYGLDRARLPIDPEAPDEADVERFLELAAGLPRPLFLHSRNGERATAFGAILHALETGKTGAEAWEAAADLGLQTSSTRLYSFTVREVARRTQPPATT